MVEGVKASVSFDRSKFEKSVSTDVYNEDGNKVNAALKYTWTPAGMEHAFNKCVKVDCNDLGGVKAAVQGEFDLKLKRNGDKYDDTKEAKANAVIAGDDWKFGVSGEFLKDANKFGALMTYEACSKSMVYLQTKCQTPADKKDPHASVSVGATMKDNDWDHVWEMRYKHAAEVAGEKKEGDAEAAKEKKNFNGLWGFPVQFRSGHECNVSSNTAAKISATYDENCEIHASTSHKLDSNTTVRMHQHFNSKNINASDKNAVDVGFELSYKL